MRPPFIRRRMRDQIVSIGAIELPHHIQVREAFDIHQPRRKLAQNLQHAFGIMFCAQAAWNLRRLFVRALHKSDRQQG